MMTLIQADALTAPIWKSPLLESDNQLKMLLQNIKDLIPKGGYVLKNPFKLNQLEILDEKLERAFRAFRKRFDEIGDSSSL